MKTTTPDPLPSRRQLLALIARQVLGLRNKIIDRRWEELFPDDDDPQA